VPVTDQEAIFSAGSNAYTTRSTYDVVQRHTFEADLIQYLMMNCLTVGAVIALLAVGIRILISCRRVSKELTDQAVRQGRGMDPTAKVKIVRLPTL
jgi:hypothetical protein